MAIAYVTSASISAPSPGPTTLALTINIGDTVVINLGCGGAGPSGATITDDGAAGGNTYTRQVVAGDPGKTAEIFTSLNVSKAATQLSISNTVTTFMCAATYTGVVSLGGTTTNTEFANTDLEIGRNTELSRANNWMIFGLGVNARSYTSLAGNLRQPVSGSTTGALVDNTVGPGPSLFIPTWVTFNLGANSPGLATLELVTADLTTKSNIQNILVAHKIQK